jgi:hypothetical protein
MSTKVAVRLLAFAALGPLICPERGHPPSQGDIHLPYVLSADSRLQGRSKQATVSWLHYEAQSCDMARLLEAFLKSGRAQERAVECLVTTNDLVLKQSAFLLRETRALPYSS